MCFSGWTEVPLRRKVGSRAWRVRASSLERGILLELCVQLNWRFQVTFSLLCCCCAIKAMCSTVACCNSNVLYNSACEDRSGMAAPKGTGSPVALRMVLWQSSFWCCWVSFQNSFPKMDQNRRFSAWALRWYGSCNLCSRCERNSIKLCNSVSADRLGWHV